MEKTGFSSNIIMSLNPLAETNETEEEHTEYANSMNWTMYRYMSVYGCRRVCRTKSMKAAATTTKHSINFSWLTNTKDLFVSHSLRSGYFAFSLKFTFFVYTLINAIFHLNIEFHIFSLDLNRNWENEDMNRFHESFVGAITTN